MCFSGPSDNPVQPTGSSTPTACDPRLTFDAITTLRGEILFFKDKYVIELFLPLASFIGVTYNWVLIKSHITHYSAFPLNSTHMHLIRISGVFWVTQTNQEKKSKTFMNIQMFVVI